MCFKLDNGVELFSVQDMHRLRKTSSGAMGSRSWVDGVAHPRGKQGADFGSGRESGAVEPRCDREYES